MSGPRLEESSSTSFLLIPLRLTNLLEAETYGVELAADWRAMEGKWRLRTAYSLLEMKLHPGPGIDPFLSKQAEGESPTHQLYLWSSSALRRNLRLDGVARFVDRLPFHDFDRYLGLDLRLAWEPVDGVEIALVGRDLLQDHHPEFQATLIDTQPTETPRRAHATLSWFF